MSDHFDSETGEIFGDDITDDGFGDDAQTPPPGHFPSAASPPSRKRRDRVWETAPDGARRQRSLTPSEQAEANAARPTRLEPGTWRYDVGPEGKRFKRPLSADEIKAREDAKRAFSARREEERGLLAKLIPVLRTPDDPPPQHEHLGAMDERTSAGVELLSITRPNGSRLRLAGKFYDGTGRSGIRALDYVSAYVIFTNPISGLMYRTRGVMVERGEMRAVAEALLRRATELDSAEENRSDR